MTSGGEATKEARSAKVAQLTCSSNNISSCMITNNSSKGSSSHSSVSSSCHRKSSSRASYSSQDSSSSSNCCCCSLNSSLKYSYSSSRLSQPGAQQSLPLGYSSGCYNHG